MDYYECYVYTDDDTVCSRCTSVECPYNINIQLD